MPTKLNELSQEDQNVVLDEAKKKVKIELSEDRENSEKLRKADIEAFYNEWKDKVPASVKLADVKDNHIKLGRPATDFSEFILNVTTSQLKESAQKPTIQLTQKQVEGYSLSRAISAMLNGDS